MKAYIEVYGCTANKSDASIIKGILESKGYKFVKNAKDADILIILTCTVIASTEQRMLFRIKRLREFKKPLIVSGCMASAQAELVKRIAPESYLLPPDLIGGIGELIETGNLSLSAQAKCSLPRSYDGIVAPIAISEGCLFSCTYCITSKARGKLRSFPREEIVMSAQDAVKKGCREIQLTAQDISSYGMDNGERLKDLVEDICNIEGNFMVRLGMMNPKTAAKIIDDLVDIYRNDKVYKFLHLPVQSGDDAVLRKMGRGYRVMDFLKITETFREEFPDVTISTDIIVAFPGENEDAFMKSVNLVKEIKPDIVNITRFSPRMYTEASSFKDRVPTHIAKERSRTLTKISKDISLQRNRRYVGRTFKVLLTERGKNSTTVGRAPNYKPVVISGKLSLGSFVDAKIIGAKPTYLLGSI